MEKLAPEIDGLTCTQKGFIDDIKVARYKNEDGASLVTIRRQIFAGRGVPSRETRQALVDWIHGKLSASDFAPEKKKRASSKKKKSFESQKPEAIQYRSTTKTITLMDNTDGDALIWPRHIGERKELNLERFSFEMSEEELHIRIGGYWKLGKKRAKIISQALQQGKRVFVAGVNGKKVLRVLEDGFQSDVPISQNETSSTRTYEKHADQPKHYATPSGAWATLFTEKTEELKHKKRARLHTKSFDDDALIGRQINISLGQNPKLYSFDIESEEKK